MTNEGEGFDLQSWKMALEFLQEAEQAVPTVQPRMTIHASYYAMFHAARAYLIRVDGLVAPTKHNAVTSRFGHLASLAADAVMMAAGHSLNEIQDQRLRSDYKQGWSPDSGRAAEAVAAARSFIAVCAQRLGYPPP